ncbi:MAG: riboflavin synthase, partial [Planctomycetota bacterium]
RLDGHIVQGHVDQVGLCVKKQENDGSWSFVFSYKVSRENIIVEKGSICINGISLTAFNVTNETFEVAIIPYTIEHTNLKNVDVNTPVNLEFDIIGKYVARINAL